MAHSSFLLKTGAVLDAGAKAAALDWRWFGRWFAQKPHHWAEQETKRRGPDWYKSGCVSSFFGGYHDHDTSLCMGYDNGDTPVSYIISMIHHLSVLVEYWSWQRHFTKKYRKIGKTSNMNNGLSKSLVDHERYWMFHPRVDIIIFPVGDDVAIFSVASLL